MLSLNSVNTGIDTDTEPEPLTADSEPTSRSTLPAGTSPSMMTRYVVYSKVEYKRAKWSKMDFCIEKGLMIRVMAFI
ncbi:uncharacterized [Tachysurus ichikawai]